MENIQIDQDTDLQDLQEFTDIFNTENILTRGKWILDNLPSGSGLNYKWDLEFNTDRLLYVASTSYQVMSDNGFYSGHFDLQVSITYGLTVDVAIADSSNVDDGLYYDEESGESYGWSEDDDRDYADHIWQTVDASFAWARDKENEQK